MLNILRMFFNTVEKELYNSGKLQVGVGQNVQNPQLVHTISSTYSGYTQTLRMLSDAFMNSFFSTVTSRVAGLYTYSTGPTKTTNLIYKRMY